MKNKSVKRFRQLSLLGVSVVALGLVGCNTNIYREDYQLPKNNVVKIKRGHYHAVTPNCDLPTTPGASSDQLAVTRFGCSTRANLGKMVARPKDLVRPKKTRTHTAAPLVRSVEAYRNTSGNGNNVGANGR